MEDTSDVQALIVRDFELSSNEETLTEETLLHLLAHQIDYYIEHKLESLMSLMYRLDIPEAKVQEILSVVHEETTNILLAKLVLQRQKQRVFTKKYYQQNRLEDIDDKLRW